MKRRTLLCAMAGVTALTSADPLTAQDCCPGKCCPSRIVVGFAPGGPTDQVARILAADLAQRWGTTVVVENVPGASGLIASRKVLEAAPDGRTLLITNDSLVTNAAVMPAGASVLQGLAPIAQLTSTPFVLLVKADSPYRSLQDLLTAARREPNKLRMGSGGNASASHIAGIMLLSEAGVSATHIPYKGAGPALTDLVQGPLDFMLVDPAAAASAIQQGKARALASSGPARLQVFKDVPTAAEAGLRRYDFSTWVGMFAPPGFPPAATSRVAGDVAAAIGSPQVREQFSKAGVVPAPLAAQDFAARIRQDFQARSRVISAHGVKVD